MAKGKRPTKNARPREARATVPNQHNSEAIITQQRVLNIFKEACSIQHGDFDTTLQTVKKHLYMRDFAAAFSKDEYLSVYAARWSPSRCLGYLQLLVDFDIYLRPLLARQSNIISEPSPPAGTETFDSLGHPTNGSNHSQDPPPQTQIPLDWNIACIGGGAGAELVACATWLGLILEKQDHDKTMARDGRIYCIDMADWSQVLARLDRAISTSDDNRMNPGRMRTTFERRDVLDTDFPSLRDILSKSRLITIMFTLNELYSASVAKTQRLLHELTLAAQPGTLLLVVDSPGSYSSVTINGSAKKYPMHWLLDHTMLATSTKRGEADDAKWEKLVSEESKWFRLPSGLQYSLCELENMRYQVHLYKRLDLPTTL